MSDIETAVSEHYGSQNLLERIVARLGDMGIAPEDVTPDDLAPVDELHVGGRAATEYAVLRLGPLKGDQVLDIGCGIGGAARYLAAHVGCRVTGIDLTPEFIAVARALSQMTGLQEQTAFEVASALDMPFEVGAFDAAITLHVAMNIPDRAGLYAEAARVLKPGGRLCVYDVMRKGEGAVPYPMPWAEGPETSHLTTPGEMADLLEGAGFEVELTEDRADFAKDFFRRSFAAMQGGPKPLGPHLIMGANAREKLENISGAVSEGLLAPVLMMARRRG
jgi:SAM-dependent methyltransferase